MLMVEAQNAFANVLTCSLELRKELSALMTDQIQDRTIFFRKNGKPLSHEAFTRGHFDKDVLEAKVRKIRFHDLRHAVATLMLAEGIDINTVKELLGHQDITTTMRYVHLLGSNIKRAGELFGLAPKRFEDPNKPRQLNRPLRLVV